MSDSFKVGDAVQLKSGGPEMTVQSVPSASISKMYTCQWFAGKKLDSGKFPADSIIAFVPAKDPN